VVVARISVECRIAAPIHYRFHNWTSVKREPPDSVYGGRNLSIGKIYD